MNKRSLIQTATALLVAAALSPVLAQDKPAADCQIGEKMWRNRSWMLDSR